MPMNATDTCKGNGPNGLGLAPHTVRLLLSCCHLVGGGGGRILEKSAQHTHGIAERLSVRGVKPLPDTGRMAAPRSTRTCLSVLTPFGVIADQHRPRIIGSTVRDTRPASSSRADTGCVMVGCELWSSVARSEYPGLALVPRSWTAASLGRNPEGMRTRWVPSRLIRPPRQAESAPSVAVMTSHDYIGLTMHFNNRTRQCRQVTEWWEGSCTWRLATNRENDRDRAPAAYSPGRLAPNHVRARASPR